MTWLETSYMARKGVAKGKPGARHQLTEAKQGKYHYVYGPYAEPGAHASSPGDVVVAETQDAFEGAIKSESDKPSRDAQHAVPQSAMRPDRGRGSGEGRRALRPHPLASSRAARSRSARRRSSPSSAASSRPSNTAMLNPPLPETVKKMEVTEQGIRFNEKITLPYEPFIGTLGVSPEIEAVTSLQPDYWGGNMDVPDVGAGAIVYFPVHHKDAYLYLGDCHATQGDGELLRRRRRDTVRPRPSRSTSSRNGRSPGRGSRTSASS